MNATSTLENETKLNINLEENLEAIFKKHFNLVCSSIYNLIPDYTLAEDLAQDVFCDLWRKREHLQINTSLKAYLRKSGVNKALNHIRKKKVSSNNDDTDILLNIKDASQSSSLEYVELQEYINSVIDKLPSRCRVIFMLSRFEEYSYKEIAAELNISTKTVENQISKALKRLRKAMISYEKQGELSTDTSAYLSIAC